MESSVVLPEPEWPVIARYSPLSIVRLAPSSAVVSFPCREECLPEVRYGYMRRRHWLLPLPFPPDISLDEIRTARSSTTEGAEQRRRQGGAERHCERRGARPAIVAPRAVQGELLW